MARTVSGKISQPQQQGPITDEAFNQLVNALTTPPPGPSTNSIPGRVISRSSSGKIRQQPITQEHLDQADEATKQAMLAILADKMGIDIRESLAKGQALDQQLQSVEGKTFRAENEKNALEAKLQELTQQEREVTPPLASSAPQSTSPSTPAAQPTKLKPGELDKSPTILAKYSAPNDIIATVDSNGQLNLSNTAQNTGAKIIQINKEQADIQKQMDAITKEEDLNTREALLSKFHADQVEQQTQSLTAFRAKAEQQLGITQLRGQLAEGIRTDQADPNYKYYRTDSQSTLRIRQMLQQSESQVERVTQEMAMADPTFKRRNTEITDFISMQQKQIMQMMNRQASGEQKSAFQAEKRAEKVDAAASVLTPVGIGIVQARNPELATDPENIKELAYNLMTTPATKLEAQMLLALPDDHSVYQAAALGATIADPYIAKKQQELTGDLPEQTMRDLREIRTMVSPAGVELVDAKMKAYGDSKMREAWKLQKGQMLTNKTVEGRRQQQITLLETALRVKGIEKERYFYNQVNDWKPIEGKSLYDLPEVKELLSKNQSVSLQELVNNYVSKAPKEVRAARFQQLRDIAVGNMKLANAGMLGAVTRMEMLNAKMTSYTLMNTLTSTLPSMALEAGLMRKVDPGKFTDIYDALQ